MAEHRRSTPRNKIIWTAIGLFILLLVVTGLFFAVSFQNIKSKNMERQTLQTNAIKGKVWMERANKAHDAGNHDQALELLIKSAGLEFKPAILSLVQKYETGSGAPKSHIKAHEWAEKLTERDYAQFLNRQGFELSGPGRSVEDQTIGLGYLEKAISLSSFLANDKNIKRRIGRIYSRGHESLRDYEKARIIYEELGGEDLEFYLGSRGDNLERSGDTKQARKFYEEAARKGSDKAKVSLAYSYLNDHDDETGRNKAIDLFRGVLDSEDTYVRYRTALFFVERGPQEDIAMGLKNMMTLADEGHTQSLLFLIDYYTDNPNVTPDYAQAKRYLTKMTYQPPKAKLMLAHLKRTGTSTDKDLKGAFQLYQDAANESFDPAKFSLAHMYRLGLGTPKDPRKAQTLYEGIRYDDRHPASYYIGLMYEKGDLGRADIKKAITLYELAAEAEYGPALMRLASFYETGRHVTKDETKAFKLMTEAAYEDATGAIENLVRYYTDGIGTERNSEYAAIWRVKKTPPSPLAFPQ